VSRQEQRRLAGRVTSADDRDLLTFAPLGLGLRRSVVDAYALEMLQLVLQLGGTSSLR
jgi:hypothetical protein